MLEGLFRVFWYSTAPLAGRHWSDGVQKQKQRSFSTTYVNRKWGTFRFNIAFPVIPFSRLSRNYIPCLGQTNTELYTLLGTEVIKHALSSDTSPSGLSEGVPPPRGVVPPHLMHRLLLGIPIKIAKERVEIADSMHCTTRLPLITEFFKYYLWLLALKECPNAVC